MRKPSPERGQAVLFLRAHLTESAIEPIRTEKRIVAKAFVSPRRPYSDSIDATLKIFNMAVRPGETKRSNEMCTPLLGRPGASLDQQRLNSVHGGAKILLRPGPARGVNAGRSTEGIDDQARIVGE
jgi:hypothetical protein